MVIVSSTEFADQLIGLSKTASRTTLFINNALFFVQFKKAMVLEKNDYESFLWK